MTAEQIVTLIVLVAVIVALIRDKMRADVVALAGAAVLLVSGAVRPVEIQSAFASPALIALASLFVIAYAMELSGLLDAAIRRGVAICQKIGSAGIWLMIAMCGAASAFLNNTPIVVMGAPVVRDIAIRMGQSPKRYLIPLSYFAVLGGCCTLIGTSTNLLVNDMAANAGQARFGMFEVTPVGLALAGAGGIFLFFSSHWLARDETKAGEGGPTANAESAVELKYPSEPDVHHTELAKAELFAPGHKLVLWKALTSVSVFILVIVLASLNIIPIAAAAFAGAVLLIMLKVITADEAYQGLRPEILILIAGMVVLGIALEQTGLAAQATGMLIGSLDSLSPLLALILLYGATLFLTELLSNATVAVLVTPVAVALADALMVSPRPFIVAVMMAGSAAFATPFGYQTNVLVYQMGGYSYMDFVRVGLPLNIVTWAAACVAIPRFFPF